MTISSFGRTAPSGSNFHLPPKEANASAGQGFTISEVAREAIARHLYMAGLPASDLMLRTSGELRVLEFLVWQHAYIEAFLRCVPGRVLQDRLSPRRACVSALHAAFRQVNWVWAGGRGGKWQADHKRTGRLCRAAGNRGKRPGGKGLRGAAGRGKRTARGDRRGFPRGAISGFVAGCRLPELSMICRRPNCGS
jgi:hypothetical protein